jgi:hypothetical protein
MLWKCAVVVAYKCTKWLMLPAPLQASVPEPGPGAERLCAPPQEGLPPDVGDTIAAAAAAFSITEKVHLRSTGLATDGILEASCLSNQLCNGCAAFRIAFSGRHLFSSETATNGLAGGGG